MSQTPEPVADNSPTPSEARRKSAMEKAAEAPAMLIWTRAGRAIVGKVTKEEGYYKMTEAALVVFDAIETFLDTGKGQATHYVGNLTVMESGIDLIIPWKHNCFKKAPAPIPTEVL